jgi:hypothetical protein
MIQKRQGILQSSYQKLEIKDGSYEGQSAFGQPHGPGSLTFKNSDEFLKFNGHWIGG